MRKQDMLLLLIAVSGEMPADLAEQIIGSVSYTASVITRLKQEGYPVYFCYELEMRHLLRVKQELGWKKQGTILCLSYQKNVLETYFGKEVAYREILTEKVLDYLGGL